MLEDRMLVLRQFDKYDETSHKVIEIGLPVEICECSANRVAERELDALAEAILKLINVGFSGDKEISDILYMSSDLIKHIKAAVLFPHNYISTDFKSITESGKKYLEDGESEDFQSEKVFGQMFVSMLDQEVMPYFLEGKLPASRTAKNISKFIAVNNEKDIVVDTGQYTSKFMQAYLKYCRISKYSDDDVIDEIEFINDELSDVLFEEVGDAGDDFTTLEDVEKNKKRRFDFIKILNTARKKIYLKTKIVVNRDNPELFTVLSPFERNITIWFTKRLTWMRENNIKVLNECGAERSINEILNDVTQEFYIEFPELQSSSFDNYINFEYPNLRKIRCQPYLVESFRGVYNLTNLYNKEKQVDATEVIIKSQKLLETILNNYISLIDNKREVFDKFDLISTDTTKVKEIFKQFGIYDCVILRNDKWKNSVRNFSFNKYGSSILDRYFLLTLEAYFYGRNPFKTILLKDGANFISMLDSLNRTRNKYGAHSDDVVEKDMSDTDYKKFESLFQQVVKNLINNLYEGEQING